MRPLNRLTLPLAMTFILGVAGCGNAPGAASPAALPSNSQMAADPGVTPVGQVLFTRTTGADVQAIFIANADGSDERQLTELGDYCCLLRISPDRTQILVMPGEDPPPTPITGGTLATNGSDFAPLQLTDPTLNLVPQAWSPDGTRIAFEGWDESDPSRTGVYTARAADGHDRIRVTTADGLPHDMPLDYSPDGTRLVFYRAIAAEPNFPIDIGGSLWVVNVDGSDAQQLETPPVGPFARWSPDGTKILFAAERLQPTGAIWTVQADGSGLTKVFEDSDGGFPIGPTWSPDGDQIMFLLDPTNDAFSHPDNELYVMNADGADVTLVIGSPDFKSQPEWWR